MVLVGQPGLVELLRKQEFRQFAQRISADYFIQPLTLIETEYYIKHRITVAGGDAYLFKRAVYATIYYHKW